MTAEESKKAKEFLRQYINAKKRFKSISDEMIEIRSAATRITPVISDMPSGSHVNDKIALSIERLDKCYDMLAKEAKRMHEAMESVRKAIDLVEDEKYRHLLEMRYINGYKWEQIAILMHHDYRYVLKLHGWALQKVDTK